MLRHVDSELQELRQLILAMGGCVEKGLAEVCQALFNKDPQRFQEVHRQEARINELQIEVDQACVRLLAKQAPVARDLRFVVGIIKINTDLERMGDQVVNIAHCASDLFKQGQGQMIPADVVSMADKVRAMVRDSLDAFVRRDLVLAKEILGRDDEVDQLKDKIINDSVAFIRQHPHLTEASIEMIAIAKNFERLADHATNIGEEVIYVATGDDVRHGQSRGSQI